MTTLDCGCEHSVSGEGMWLACEVTLCPLHEAAPRMAEMLRLLAEQFEKEGRFSLSDDIREVLGEIK